MEGEEQVQLLGRRRESAFPVERFGGGFIERRERGTSLSLFFCSSFNLP